MDEDIKQMLEGLKGNDRQGSISENSDVESESCVKNVIVDQILDEIIEKVLTMEELKSIWIALYSVKAKQSIWITIQLWNILLLLNVIMKPCYYDKSQI